MAQRVAPGISIKGIRDGLLIMVGDEPYDDLLGDLAAELTAKKEFLRGSRVALAVGEQSLGREQLAELQDLLARQGLALWAVLAEAAETKDAARDLGLATRLPGSQTDLEGKALDVPLRDDAVSMATLEDTAVPDGLLLKETLRSGRSVYHEGHVVVIGDVNPGAEIIAGGDVVVWGRLRGLVHAGAHGNTDAVICALELIPTQLRIADQIAISPQGQQRPLVPEKVSIRGGRIVAEAWQSR